MAQNESIPSSGNRVTRFYHEVKSEMRKVTWPTRSELYGATIVIFVVTVAVSLAVGLADWGFVTLMEVIY